MSEQRTGTLQTLVAGASVRSAAQSMVRAGFEPICADLFGDLDLREIADVHVIIDYPEGFIDWADDIHHKNGRLPFMYTGGLENYPKIIDSIAERHTLIGNAGESLRRIRDPGQLSDCFFKSGILHPAVRIGANAELLANPKVRWLRKPIAGSAGFGITEWNRDKVTAERFLQQRIDGPSVSALYVATAGEARLIGTTAQLVGCPSLSGGPFGWCGSFGPLPLSGPFASQATAIGNCLAAEFRLQGIFGVDCIVDDQSLVPIEVNPRYTGSVEVLEKALNWHAIPEHIIACHSENDAAEYAVQNPLFTPKDQPAKLGYCGKAILFAPQSLTVNNLSRIDITIADVPMDGTVIQQGNPICTIMDSGTELIDCIGRLSDNVRQVAEQLFGHDVGFDREIRQIWQQLCDSGLID